MKKFIILNIILKTLISQQKNKLPTVECKIKMLPFFENNTKFLKQTKKLKSNKKEIILNCTNQLLFLEDKIFCDEKKNELTIYGKKGKEVKKMKLKIISDSSLDFYLEDFPLIKINYNNNFCAFYLNTSFMQLLVVVFGLFNYF